MKKHISRVILLMLIAILILTGCSPAESIQGATGPINKESSISNKPSEDKKDTLLNDKANEKTPINNIGEMEVHFIDVGQGDSVFIKQGNQTMLIDAGDNQYGTTVVNYLKSQNVEKLDYVIGTHPHADHIGGLDDVINSFKVDKIIMPNKMHTTKTFEDVLEAIAKQGLKITTPVVGDVYKVGEANFTILAPNKTDYNNLNNYSVALKLELGNKSFFFSGDNEKQAEQEIVNNGQSLKSTVMKAGHHGSNTSNTDILLDKVNPDFIVIQVGENNKYDHPNQDILQKFAAKGITVYRNDLHGNIVIKTDGESLQFETTKGETPNNVVKDKGVKEIVKNTDKPINQIKPDVDNSKKQDNNDINKGEFIGTKTTKKFHIATCRHVPNENNREYFKTSNEAIGKGYEACKVCKPTT